MKKFVSLAGAILLGTVIASETKTSELNAQQDLDIPFVTTVKPVHSALKDHSKVKNKSRQNAESVGKSSLTSHDELVECNEQHDEDDKLSIGSGQSKTSGDVSVDSSSVKSDKQINHLKKELHKRPRSQDQQDSDNYTKKIYKEKRYSSTNTYPKDQVEVKEIRGREQQKYLQKYRRPYNINSQKLPKTRMPLIRLPQYTFDSDDDEDDDDESMSIMYTPKYQQAYNVHKATLSYQRPQKRSSLYVQTPNLNYNNGQFVKPLIRGNGKLMVKDAIDDQSKEQFIRYSRGLDASSLPLYVMNSQNHQGQVSFQNHQVMLHDYLDKIQPLRNSRKLDDLAVQMPYKPAKILDTSYGMNFGDWESQKHNSDPSRLQQKMLYKSILNSQY
ncbi:UNKNOWN [Stylonychia lemnae]|uniref:Uncharacterized protein n=1 Tax=Stylonychia lemnae TaxID=5949 RepID=A0A077ZSM6_STYLE|nr:UNKNOWN [Stylonychia lemnae]|eukprot:CDW72310.1 UNKNOWN [Stylonychia lemnae]